jgi:hypothetical protein
MPKLIDVVGRKRCYSLHANISLLVETAGFHVYDMRIISARNY